MIKWMWGTLTKKLRRANSPFELSFQEIELFANFNAAEFWEKVSEGLIKARYISPFSIILHQNGVYPKIGEGTWIGHYTIIDGFFGLEIGSNCEISSGVHIYTHSTAKRCTVGKGKEAALVRISDNVFIGPNSIVSMGCQIGSHALVAPLSYVSPHTEIPEYAFYAGIPAVKKGDMRDKK